MWWFYRTITNIIVMKVTMDHMPWLAWWNFLMLELVRGRLSSANLWLTDSDGKLCDRATGFATPGPHSIGVIVTQAVHPKPQGGFSLTNRSQSVEQATQTWPGVNDDSEEAAQETSSYFTLPSPPLPQQYAGRRRWSRWRWWWRRTAEENVVEGLQGARGAEQWRLLLR